MLRYYIIMKNVVIAIAVAVLGGLVAIMISNNARQRVLAEYARDTIETCEEDGATGCHSVWVYDGLVLTDFYVSGQTMEAQDE